jgi:hypothetical protein
LFRLLALDSLPGARQQVRHGLGVFLLHKTKSVWKDLDYLPVVLVFIIIIMRHGMENHAEVNRPPGCTPINSKKRAWAVHRPEDFEVVGYFRT